MKAVEDAKISIYLMKSLNVSLEPIDHNGRGLRRGVKSDDLNFRRQMLGIESF